MQDAILSSLKKKLQGRFGKRPLGLRQPVFSMKLAGHPITSTGLAYVIVCHKNLAHNQRFTPGQSKRPDTQVNITPQGRPYQCASIRSKGFIDQYVTNKASPESLSQALQPYIIQDDTRLDVAKSGFWGSPLSYMFKSFQFTCMFCQTTSSHLLVKTHEYQETSK